jgi:hypothetical protein
LLWATQGLRVAAFLFAAGQRLVFVSGITLTAFRTVVRYVASAEAGRPDL